MISFCCTPHGVSFSIVLAQQSKLRPDRKADRLKGCCKKALKTRKSFEI